MKAFASAILVSLTLPMVSGCAIIRELSQPYDAEFEVVTGEPARIILDELGKSQDPKLLYATRDEQMLVIAVSTSTPEATLKLATNGRPEGCANAFEPCCSEGSHYLETPSGYLRTDEPCEYIRNGPEGESSVQPLPPATVEILTRAFGIGSPVLSFGLRGTPEAYVFVPGVPLRSKQSSSIDSAGLTHLAALKAVQGSSGNVPSFSEQVVPAACKHTLPPPSCDPNGYDGGDYQCKKNSQGKYKIWRKGDCDEGHAGDDEWSGPYERCKCS